MKRKLTILLSLGLLFITCSCSNSIFEKHSLDSSTEPSFGEVDDFIPTSEDWDKGSDNDDIDELGRPSSSSEETSEE